jgi:hypothetical protein
MIKMITILVLIFYFSYLIQIIEFETNDKILTILSLKKNKWIQMMIWEDHNPILSYKKI